MARIRIPLVHFPPRAPARAGASHTHTDTRTHAAIVLEKVENPTLTNKKNIYRFHQRVASPCTLPCRGRPRARMQEVAPDMTIGLAPSSYARSDAGRRFSTAEAGAVSPNEHYNPSPVVQRAQRAPRPPATALTSRLGRLTRLETTDMRLLVARSPSTASTAPRDSQRATPALRRESKSVERSPHRQRALRWRGGAGGRRPSARPQTLLYVALTGHILGELPARSKQAGASPCAKRSGKKTPSRRGPC